MLRIRIGLLALALTVLIVPTGCNDDVPQKVDTEPTITSPKQISQWLEQLNAIFRATNTSGPEASRILAYASIAYYEGYALSTTEMRTLVGQLEGLDALPQPEPELIYNYGLIAEAAMYKVLDEMFANAPANIQLVLSSTYTNHERDYFYSGLTQTIIDRSRNFGYELGEAILAWSAQDGHDQLANCTATIPNEPGNWRPTPPDFASPKDVCWGELRAFTFTPSQLVALCNPGLPQDVNTQSGSAYMNDIVEVQELGDNLNSAQEEIARFWNDGPTSFTVPGHYISILGQLVDQNILNGQQTVVAFAQLCIAMADTYISTYKQKYTYFRPRPATIIQDELDNNWESELLDPSTPEYPSLRATLGYAASQVFIHRYGEREFTDRTYISILSIDERIYSSFSEMGQEAALSRLYAGTNIRSTIEASEYHGRCIAQRANELFLTE
ncbi:MAG: hypothetical protein H6601_09845 [Flavobacteriales bacterium]|nr:hypothetical protein [Flavobacteriales bacterium]